jgi:hypothetical protein
MPADEPCSRGQQPTAQQLPEVLSRRPRRLVVVVPIWRLVQAKGFCSCTLCRYLLQNCESSVKNGPECGRRSGPSTRRGQGFSPGGLATDRLPPFVPNAGPLNIGDSESTAPQARSQGRALITGGAGFVIHHLTAADGDGSCDGTQNGPERSRSSAGAANLALRLTPRPASCPGSMESMPGESVLFPGDRSPAIHRAGTIR